MANIARWDGDPSKTSHIVSFFLIGDQPMAWFKTALFEVTRRTESIPLSRSRSASRRSDSCRFTRFCRSWRKSQTRGFRRRPGRERLLRSGRNGELDGLFRHQTAFSVHTCHTWYAQKRGTVWQVCAEYVSGMTACDARVDVAFNCPDGVEKHADELSGTGKIGKMRRTKPIWLNPSASWKHNIRFKLRQIPALVRDLTSRVAQPMEGSTPQ